MNALANSSAQAAADSSFTPPADPWYQIEATGEHPNKRAGVVQVIDQVAIDSIVNTFNRGADSSPNFAGVLIDHEHFKHDEDKETRAYGWLMRLRNRAGILEGQIRWTGTGRQAVDTGDYRFFSTEYDSKDLQVLSNSKPRRVRPLRLDGLTLTNVPNNKGQKPITNRQPSTPQIRNNMNIQDLAHTEADNGLSVANRAPAADLHSEAMAMAAQSGKRYTDCRTFLMCSRSWRYGLAINATPSAPPTAPDPVGEAVINRRNEAIAEYRRANPMASYDRARSAVRNRYPGLFGLGEPPMIALRSAAPVENGDANAAIDEGIRQLRASDSTLSYISARNLLRNRQPALFGVSSLDLYP
jgi:hypothetical protein